MVLSESKNLQSSLPAKWLFSFFKHMLRHGCKSLRSQEIMCLKFPVYNALRTFAPDVVKESDSQRCFQNGTLGTVQLVLLKSMNGT